MRGSADEGGTRKSCRHEGDEESHSGTEAMWRHAAIVH